MWFCCKQETAYEMRIRDWSSDVCASDLRAEPGIDDLQADRGAGARLRSLGQKVGPAGRRGPVGDEDFRVTCWANHRSEERRVGKECVSTCSSRRSPQHTKKNTCTTHTDSITLKVESPSRLISTYI